MELKAIKSNKEFVEEFNTISYGHKNLELEIRNLSFEYGEMAYFSKPNIKKIQGALADSISSVNSNISHFRITNCDFVHGIGFHDLDVGLRFVNCKFHDIRAKNVTFSKNIRFHDCTFKGNTDFENTVFENLVDFYNSTFENAVHFLRTDFNSIAVFSAVKFKKNVLFTYSLFNDVAIFRGTKFDKGLDLSLSIVKGKLSLFDLPIRWWWWDFRSKKGNLTEKEYDDCLNQNIIPVKNKRETFRILKKHYEDVNNIGDSVSLAVMEKNTLFVEIVSKIFSANKNNLNWFWFLWGKLLDFFNLLILILNAISNWHKSSYVTGILFTGITGALFFNLSISYTYLSDTAFTFDLNTMKEGFKYYLSFLNPTHKFEYLGEHILKDSNTRNGFYLFDYLGRIFVGYGIYQTIQAFRKYR